MPNRVSAPGVDQDPSKADGMAVRHEGLSGACKDGAFKGFFDLWESESLFLQLLGGFKST